MAHGRASVGLAATRDFRARWRGVAGRVARWRRVGLRLGLVRSYGGRRAVGHGSPARRDWSRRDARTFGLGGGVARRWRGGAALVCGSVSCAVARAGGSGARAWSRSRLGLAE